MPSRAAASLFKAGGKVVKNVTGYDLPKLLAGSWGTLAVLTEVTLRVAPAPELDRTLVVAAGSAGECLDLLGRALRSPHDVSAAGVDPERGSLLRLEGFAASVEARTRALVRRARLHAASGARRRGVARVLARAGECRGAGRESRRVAHLRTARPMRCACSNASSPDRYLLDWGGGLILAAYASVDAPHVRGALTSGHATLLKAPAAARSATAVFQPQPPAGAAAAARLRSAFDPRGILNPGRMD